jgi:hypothetical protein
MVDVGFEGERGTIRRHSRGRAGERSGPGVPAQTRSEANIGTGLRRRDASDERFLRYAGRNSNLHLEADLDHLCGWNPEIGRWQVGIEVHCREQPLAPYRHAGHLAARDDHDPP